MKRTLYAAAIAMTVTLTLAAVPAVAGAARPAAAPAHQPADMGMGMGMGTVTKSLDAGPYRLTLIIGPEQKMYTQAEYKRLHPKKGEIMLRGHMAMPRMGMGNMNVPMRHLELHVMDRATKHVISDAIVSIIWQPIVGMGVMAIRPQNVPIAVMEGIGMGMSDIHYGNNVAMSAGKYHVWVHVGKVSATFVVHLM